MGRVVLSTVVLSLRGSYVRLLDYGALCPHYHVSLFIILCVF